MIDLTSQVHQSDTGPDRIWSDPTIRRNPIGIRVAKSDEILRLGFFCWISLDFVGQSDEIQSNPTLRISSDSTTRIPIKSYKILSDFVGLRWVPMGSVLDPLSDSWTWVEQKIDRYDSILSRNYRQKVIT